MENVSIQERLLSKTSLETVDPKANYRTRPISLYEEAAAYITKLEAELQKKNN